MESSEPQQESQLLLRKVEVDLTGRPKIMMREGDYMKVQPTTWFTKAPVGDVARSVLLTIEEESTGASILEGIAAGLIICACALGL